MTYSLSNQSRVFQSSYVSDGGDELLELADESVRDRFVFELGHFFFIDLGVLASKLNRLGVKIIKRMVVGSSVPNLAGRSHSPFNDVDIQLRITTTQESDIQDQLVFDVHGTVMDFFGLPFENGTFFTGSPFASYKLLNSAAKPIDLTLYFKDMETPDASSTRDCFKISFTEVSPFDFSLKLGMSKYVAHYCHFWDALDLIESPCYKASYQHAQSIERDALLIYLRHEVQLRLVYLNEKTNQAEDPAQLYQLCCEKFFHQYTSKHNQFALSNRLCIFISKEYATTYQYLEKLAIIIEQFALKQESSKQRPIIGFLENIDYCAQSQHHLTGEQKWKISCRVASAIRTIKQAHISPKRQIPLVEPSISTEKPVVADVAPLLSLKKEKAAPPYKLKTYINHPETLPGDNPSAQALYLSKLLQSSVPVTGPRRVILLKNIGSLFNRLPTGEESCELALAAFESMPSSKISQALADYIGEALFMLPSNEQKYQRYKKYSSFSPSAKKEMIKNLCYSSEWDLKSLSQQGAMQLLKWIESDSDTLMEELMGKVELLLNQVDNRRFVAGLLKISALLNKKPLPSPSVRQEPPIPQSHPVPETAPTSRPPAAQVPLQAPSPHEATLEESKRWNREASSFITQRSWIDALRSLSKLRACVDTLPSTFPKCSFFKKDWNKKMVRVQREFQADLIASKEEELEVIIRDFEAYKELGGFMLDATTYQILASRYAQNADYISGLICVVKSIERLQQDAKTKNVDIQLLQASSLLKFFTSDKLFQMEQASFAFVQNLFKTLSNYNKISGSRFKHFYLNMSRSKNDFRHDPHPPLDSKENGKLCSILFLLAICLQNHLPRESFLLAKKAFFNITGGKKVIELSQSSDEHYSTCMYMAAYKEARGQRAHPQEAHKFFKQANTFYLQALAIDITDPLMYKCCQMADQTRQYSSFINSYTQLRKKNLCVFEPRTYQAIGTQFLHVFLSQGVIQHAAMCYLNSALALFQSKMLNEIDQQRNVYIQDLQKIQQEIFRWTSPYRSLLKLEKKMIYLTGILIQNDASSSVSHDEQDKIMALIRDLEHYIDEIIPRIVKSPVTEEKKSYRPEKEGLRGKSSPKTDNTARALAAIVTVFVFSLSLGAYIRRQLQN